jgi:aryl-alcohol dehydrogenase-like predicted oxidoreductase
MATWQFMKMQHAAPTPFVSMQNHYNLLYREDERELIPLCLDTGIGLIPYSPLERGVLARKSETARAKADPQQERRAEDQPVIDRVAEIAGERGVPPAQVALAWLLHKPGVVAPIVGASKLQHVEDALAAAELELSPDELARLEEHYVPRWPA